MERSPASSQRAVLPPSRFTAMSCCCLAIVVSPSGFAKEMPALLTRTSRRPNASSARRIAVVHVASSLTSWRRKWTSPLSPRIESATASPAGSRSVRRTRAPSRAKRIPVARPIPDAAPVTIAALPCIRFIARTLPRPGASLPADAVVLAQVAARAHPQGPGPGTREDLREGGLGRRGGGARPHGARGRERPHLGGSLRRPFRGDGRAQGFPHD